MKATQVRHMDRQETLGRMIGLGRPPSGAVGVSGCDKSFEDTAKCAFSQVPVIEYVTWTVPLPLTDEQLQQTFGDEIDVLQNPKSVSGVASVDSSFVVNGILQTDMFVVGFGIHVFGEPMSFSQIGNSIPAASVASSPPVSPDVFTANDLAHGALGPTSGISPAQLEWGFADWHAMWHLVNAYQFNWRFMQRHYLIQELAADVSYFGPYAEGVGMGTSDATIQQYVAQVNKNYTTNLGSTAAFEPITHRRLGSVNTGPTGYSAGNIGVFHPTRDFDLVPVSWGGLRNQGTTGVQTPFRRLNRPVLLERGIPIGMTLNVQDAYHQAQMLQYMSITQNGTTTPANIQMGANYSGVTAAGTGTTGGVGLELTLDTGGNQFAAQQVNTDRVLYKGGTMKLAILIKGFEVWGPWTKYFGSTNNQQSLSQWMDMPTAGATTLAGR
jgi:hypothetical protein